MGRTDKVKIGWAGKVMNNIPQIFCTNVEYNNVQHYGLYKPPPSKPKPSVFGDLDDDNSKDLSAQLREDRELQRRERQVNPHETHEERSTDVKNIKIAAEREKVLAEDATAYDYDGVYDSMKQESQKQAATKEAESARRKVCSITSQIFCSIVTNSYPSAQIHWASIEEC